MLFFAVPRRRRDEIKDWKAVFSVDKRRKMADIDGMHTRHPQFDACDRDKRVSAKPSLVMPDSIAFRAGRVKVATPKTASHTGGVGTPRKHSGHPETPAPRLHGTCPGVNLASSPSAPGHLRNTHRSPSGIAARGREAPRRVPAGEEDSPQRHGEHRAWNRR